MNNNVHDKVFNCPKCSNKTLIPVEYDSLLGIGFDEIAICEECGEEFKAKPNFDNTVEFISNEKEGL